MPHETELIGTVAVGLTAAFAFALVAVRLRLPPIVGYLLAGVAVGPFTPGFVADAHLAPQLAEIGVILLMFGVGVHFSPGDLLAVRGIALPGALGQIAAATALGVGVSSLWGWSLGEGLVFGLALSVASTVVLLRALEERSAVATPSGRVAVGWLLVEDLAMVVALVLLPTLAGPLGGTAPAAGEGGLLATLALTLGKVALFAALMFAVGWRIVPWLLHRVARIGSRELFLLATLAAALGIAFAGAEFFGVSFALGAFVAGLVVGQSEVGHEAGEQVVPLQDAFAVLFFVSVGMLIEPAFLLDAPGRILAVAAIVVVGKTAAAFLIVLLLRGGLDKAVVVGAALAQIGEFSFILASLGRSLDLLPPDGYNLILAGALVSITLNPLLFRLADGAAARAGARQGVTASASTRSGT
ncbi:MAG: Inner membrane protein YbaL, KefB/KefC family [uncultured Thermomicrobiales bacterium]|uniref:Inner membrane protein YbaL, KefB/KefC family n=1 Tax=uncultured Thermomicrobiales bacterium TaxID=1645740 RepID=A0A6J4VR03_9BACT|nr:MAG: Inner membrane protein YbaL, KefB/KefC family [uncultured Thermomicrobiales bacterium]